MPATSTAQTACSLELVQRPLDSAAAVDHRTQYASSPTTIVTRQLRIAAAVGGLSSGGRRVSYDIFFQRFERGEPVGIDKGAFLSTVTPFVAQTEAGFFRLRAPDGGEADVYADLGEEPFQGFMVNHFAGGAVLDLLVALADATDTAIFLPDLPTVVTRPDQQRHLPEVFGADVRVMATGAELGELIRPV
jgi:hypothetical protein